MSTNLLQILWFLMPLCATAGALIAWPQLSAPARWGVAMTGGTALLCWSYLTVRVTGFRVRLYRFMRQLLGGDYEAGIRTRRRFTDEVARLEGVANKLAERLQSYDRLRAARVSIQSRAFELILDRSAEALAAIDAERSFVLLNPAACKLLRIERNRFSFDSILTPEINSDFKQFFENALEGRKTLTEGVCWLQLPGMSDPVCLGVQFTPLRDRDESVRFALLALRPPQTRKPAAE